MPVTLEVIENGRILHVRFTEPWNAGDMILAFKADAAYRDDFAIRFPGQKVHLIADFSTTIHIANGALQARNSPSPDHPTSGMAVVVSSSSLLQALGRTVFRIAQVKQTRFVTTCEEALDILREVIQAEAQPEINS